MSKFRKKPVVIEAHRFAGGRTEPGWPDGWLTQAHHWGYAGESLFIETLEGVMEAQLGDWIIKGVKGEFYPCKPDIFAATYEPVQEPEPRS